MTGKDLFSGHAQDYARYRPDYPRAVVDFLVSLTPKPDTVWDAGCGNGQLSVALASHFDTVIATDISATQLAAAPLRSNITYRQEPAEAVSLPNASVDLVVAAQAIHWFRHDAFFTEVQRVLRPGGTVVALGYGLCTIRPDIDKAFGDFYAATGPYWEPERKHIDNGYSDIVFPGTLLPVPALTMTRDWTRDEFCHYLSTWTGLRKAELSLPGLLDRFRSQITPLWTGSMTVTWPLIAKAARL